MEKKCTKCGQLKSSDSFTIDRARSDGYKGTCRECCTHKTMEWKKKNREATRAASRKHYHANREAYKAYYKSLYHVDIELSRQRRRDWRTQNPLRDILTNARRRAKIAGMDFNITTDDLTKPDVCPVLGIKLDYTTGFRAECSPSIDRIDNNKGYVRGNVHIISFKANRLKSNATVKELCLVAYYFANLGQA